MCALLNYFLPDKIPYETLDPSDKKANWTLAFKVAKWVFLALLLINEIHFVLNFVKFCVERNAFFH